MMKNAFEEFDDAVEKFDDAVEDMIFIDKS